MNCIQVNTGTPYQVLIRRGILQDAGEEVKKVKPNARLAVVTDSNVSPLYLRNLLDSLERAGYKIFGKCRTFVSAFVPSENFP